MNDLINLRVIGKHLRAARDKCNLTQEEVAEKLGIQTNSYGNFERGTQKPSLNKIIQCCILFKVLPGDLLNDCAPGLQIREIPDLSLQRSEIRELIFLINQLPTETVHLLFVGLSAILQEQKITGGGC